MTDAFSDLVIPIFREVIDLTDRLNWSNPPGSEQVKREALGWIAAAERKAQADPALASEFELAKFGLVAWTDEVLAYSNWGERHRWARPSSVGDLAGRGEEQSLEMELYGEPQRAWKFYDWAGHALEAAEQSRSSTDPLEVYLICVALGFQGIYRTDEDRLQSWVDRVYTKVTEGSPLEAKPFPDETTATTGGFGSLQGSDFLLKVSILAAITAVASLIGFLTSVHALINASPSN